LDTERARLLRRTGVAVDDHDANTAPTQLIG
jgi:hypothetical protein